ncbi:DUF3737 family protein [Alloscardovia criceti]|uniref:DUF3737 family protein n=1 Tax=Alloscardovia criceti TaxID=356828 RepID=UPI000361386C|nr:DUF3737 family protein [Alloscardovia criceti]
MDCETEYEIIQDQVFAGERDLFLARNLDVRGCVFRAGQSSMDGESPLKEASNIRINRSRFEWKYPLWYAHDINLTHSELLETARSGIWYTHGIAIHKSSLAAPKTFRHASEISLVDVDMPNASETLWWCKKVSLKRISARGDYFGMQSKDINALDMRLVGNYAFDGAENITIEDSSLISKDAFWNTTNVTVKNSTIVGEYLGWNSKNLTFENCTIESLQGLCYAENLKLINCKLIDTPLAFEYSSVDAQVEGHIDSVFNPSSGFIRAGSIGELTLDPAKIDPSAVSIELTESNQSKEAQK